MKRWYVQLALFILTGLILAAVTFDLVHGFHEFAHNEGLTVLSTPGVGLGISFGGTFALICVLSFDAIWALVFVIWLLKKKFHIENTDNTIYLP